MEGSLWSSVLQSFLGGTLDMLVFAEKAALVIFFLYMALSRLIPNLPGSIQARRNAKDVVERLGRRNVKTNRYEQDVIACGVVNPSHINVEFESVGGLDHIKQELIELVILPLQRPELFAHGKLLTPQRGVLLHGPPGTGKTMLAKAIAKESKAVFINIKMSDLMSKWLGDAEKHVAAVFSLAYKLQPAIIFIDEVDSFLGQRRTTDHDSLTRMKTAFMSLWDGFTTDQNARVMVLAATNRPSVLDEAILRRFTQAYEIGVPDQSERAMILKVILKGERVADDINCSHIARLCEDFTGSDLLELCKKAAYFPVRELLDAEKNGNTGQIPRPLKQSDFEKALSTSRKARKASTEYRLRTTISAQPGHTNPDDVQFQNALAELSSLMSGLDHSRSTV